MDNPFKKRRTELITDRRTLLSLVSSVPVNEFFRNDKEEVIEKLTLVVGTPGSGKTTIAQVVEFESLMSLCQLTGSPVNEDLADVLGANGLIKDRLPKVLGHRLPMTTNFRDIWELPYADPMRIALLRAFVQSKAVLGWFNQLDLMGFSLDQVDVVMSANAESMIEITGANDAATFRKYAREIELAIFKIVTALVPPTEQDMAANILNTRYDVFEDLRGFRIRRWPDSVGQPLDEELVLRPMIIVDDAHELHPTQFTQLRDWLKSKAMGVSRWLMCRPDVISADDYREALAKDSATEESMAPGSTRGRDYLMKPMQLSAARSSQFKSIAVDIANRYVQGVPEFSRRGLKDIRPMLNRQDNAELAEGVRRQLQEKIDKLVKDARFSTTFVETLQARIRPDTKPDEALAALRILLHREMNRSPQMGLLGESELLDEPVTGDKTVSAALMEGARIQLMHEFDRPFYFGMDKLIGASNANIEQFIRLAGTLVDEVLAKVIRGRDADLTPKAQHVALVGQAKQVIKEWDFPYNAIVRQLVSNIAARCLERTLEPNASLGDGANAIGIPQNQIDTILKKDGRLARILHFAFAYKALVFIPDYSCKGKLWCLLELGALPNLAHGLPLSRGGFVEGNLRMLQGMLPTDGVQS